MSAAERILKLFAQDTNSLNSVYEQIGTESKALRDFLAENIIEQIDRLSFEAGRLVPSFANEQILAELEQVFPEIIRNITPAFQMDVLDIVDKRIEASAKLYSAIGLQNVIEPAQIKRFSTVAVSINSISESIGKGSEVAIQRIQESLFEYKAGMTTGLEFPKSEIINRIVSHGGVLPQYGNTVASTMLAKIDTDVSKAQMKQSGLTLLRYTGQVDAVTRDFCLRWVGEVRPLEFWEQLENETGPNPVSEFRGGWNCRHRLLPWDPSWDLD